MLNERDGDLLTVKQAAELLGIPRYTIRRWIRRGILPSVRIKRRWLITPGDLVAARQRRHAGDAIARWQCDPRRAGARLRQKREAAGLSQLQLATMVGLSNAALSILEQGHRAPRITSMHRLAQALDTTVDDFVAGTPLGDPATMSAADAATYLGVPVQRIRNWVGAGILPGQKISRSWHIPRTAVMDLERSGRLSGASRRVDARARGAIGLVISWALELALRLSNSGWIDGQVSAEATTLTMALLR